MSKRVPVPEGKSLFYRKPEAAGNRTVAVRPDEAEGDEQARGQTRQSAIFLEERHLDWLDDKCREARRNGGRAIRKAVIIRALLDVALSAPIDLTNLRREEDVMVRVRRGLLNLTAE